MKKPAYDLVALWTETEASRDEAMTPEEKRNAVNALSTALLNQCRINAEERGFVNSIYRERKDGTLSYTFILNQKEGSEV